MAEPDHSRIPDSPPPYTTVGEPLPQHRSASSRPSPPTGKRSSTDGMAIGSAAVGVGAGGPELCEELSSVALQLIRLAVIVTNRSVPTMNRATSITKCRKRGAGLPV
jgi:hypothetical protein